MVQKKHYTEMTPEELETVKSRVARMNETLVTICLHARMEMAEDQISSRDVLATLKQGEPIHVESNGRVLLRQTSGPRSGVCVVASLLDSTVVTTWYNRPDDNHATCDMSKYGWDADVTQFLNTL